LLFIKKLLRSFLINNKITIQEHSMSETKLRARSEIADQYKWNAESVFPDTDAWEREAAELPQVISRFERFRGRVGESPQVLLEVLGEYEALAKRAGATFIYALISREVENTNPTAGRMYGRAVGIFGQFQAAVAFVRPELVQAGQQALAEWTEREPRLEPYAHFFDDLFRQQAHLRSAEVEELLGMLAEPFSGASTTASYLTDADFKFPDAVGADGSSHPVTQGTLEEILTSTDREARRTAWEGYRDTYLAHKNTLASNLSTSIRQFVFQTRARRYPSTLEASLFANNVPVAVFHNLIDTYKKNLPTWHRYWRVRRKALGVDTLQPYDIWAPLTEQRPTIPYEQAVEWITAGLAPMGAEYAETVRRGCLEQRWVDVYPSPGKSSSQFSAGWPGTHPFIVVNYDDTIFSLSTLAHELGHSLHSYLTWQNQPMVYSDYSLFVAEVASNFHQAMVRAHLLETSTDPAFQINVIEEAMSNFHRYFFIMPTLARFELEMHERAERGEGFSADDMSTLMADLFSEGYGGEVNVDRERVGITWATFGHLYADYYVYQYATGISGANALSRRILSGQPGAVDDYLGFLKAGSSIYPLDALKNAGVDMTTPAPVEETFQILSGMVDRLEKLVG
jgi:oligoendopeptidase F